MLRQLSSSYDNGQSMVIHPSGMKHAPSVVIARAWLLIPKVWNMLRQLSSSSDNGQSMVIYP